MDHLIQSCTELLNTACSSSGDTALTAAAKNGRVEAINCLREWRVDKNRKNEKGKF